MEILNSAPTVTVSPLAGALEGKDVASRSFLGAVARPLAKLARCSLLLLTHPQIGPNPFRRIVVITDFSDCAKTALKNALWLAEADSAELVQVISIHTPFMQARAELGAEYEKPTRRREEEEQLLRDLWRQRRRAAFLSNPNRRYDDRLCRVRFYAINRRRTARRACARARRRRRAIDDGLGATSYPVQSLDRAGNLGPVRTSCEGCHVSECGGNGGTRFHPNACPKCDEASD
jgi:hypothetical protein